VRERESGRKSMRVRVREARMHTSKTHRGEEEDVKIGKENERSVIDTNSEKESKEETGAKGGE
jgi:hypothetical protein